MGPMPSSKPKSHLSGKKYTPGHTSVIEAARAPVQAAARLACVSKISLGFITSIGNGPISIKFLPEGTGCLLAKVRGSRSIQEIRVYTSDTEQTMAGMRSALS